MTETLEMKINKNTEILFDFYVDKILSLVKIKNKNVILIGLGNTKFIKFIKSDAKNVCIIDHCLPFAHDYKLIDEYQLEIDIKKYLEKNKMSKFDVAIMNPPYDGNLHLKILEKVIPIADKVVNISPIRWLQDPIVEYKKNSDYAKYEESILKHMIDFIELYQAYTNDCFGIQFNAKIGITVYDKTGGYDYKKIHESEFNEIYKKCMSKKERITPNIKLYKNLNSKNFVPVCLLGGHVDVNGYGVRFTRNRYKYFIDGKCQNSERPELYNKEPNEVKSYNLKTFDTVPCVGFDTVEETKNFYNYINSICFQYLTRGHTQDGHIYPKLLPFPTDYTNNWNDKLVCEYFGITGYIDNEHAVPNSEWEIILNTMKSIN